jgi:hypothetical protein
MKIDIESVKVVKRRIEALYMLLPHSLQYIVESAGSRYDFASSFYPGLPATTEGDHLLLTEGKMISNSLLMLYISFEPSFRRFASKIQSTTKLQLPNKSMIPLNNCMAR